MGCSCKSNSSQKVQSTQVRKSSTVSGNVVNKITPKVKRKEIVIRRPAR